MSFAPDSSTAATIAEIADSPDLPALRSELQDIVRNLPNLTTRRTVAQRVRFAEWEGQSDDNRKHESELGAGRAFPFEGAADTRIYLADTIINEKTAALCTAFFRSDLQAQGVEAKDLPAAQRVSLLLRWLRKAHMLQELRREVELAAQYMLGDDPGVAVVGAFWLQETALERKTVTLADLVTKLLETLPPEQQPAAASDLHDLFFNPAREADALAQLANEFPSTPKGKLRGALKELRAQGNTTLPSPYLRQNRPTIISYRLGEDIFVPAGTSDLQRARVIYTREWLTEVEVRERTVSHGWGDDFADELIEKGRGQSFLTGQTNDGTILDITTLNQSLAPHKQMFEVWTAWSHAVDSLGVPGLFTTVFSGSCRDTYGKHELCDYEHGEMPFHLFMRERVGRDYTQSRGLTVIAASPQYEIKVQRDMRTDYTQLATLPPVGVNARRGGLELVFGPGSQVEMQRPDDVQKLDIVGPYPQASIEVEAAARRDVDDYFGRATPEAMPARTALLQQHEADRWLDGWKGLWAQVLGLCQQYMSPAEIARVTGDPSPVRVTREDIQGKFDLTVELDVRMLNVEYLKEILPVVTQTIALDAVGIVQRDKLVQWLMQSLSPTLADGVLQTSDGATAKEAEDEIQKLAQMAVGIEAPVKGNENAPLRLKVLQQNLQSSPALQQAYQQKDGLFRKLVDARGAAFEQSIQQQQNAQTGRTGYVPQLGQGAPAQAA